MCRFLGYLGAPVVMADLLYRPQNSLILQSYEAKEREEPLNGDGFGVGWYSPEVGPTPCVFTSVTPAWSNENLRRLAPHVASPCFFAHVRAASPGMRVSEANCHPFQHGRYLWMHNGDIGGFRAIERTLRDSLPDALYHAIEGTTDSEHTFAVFLDCLGDAETPREVGKIARALTDMVARLEQWRAEAGIEEISHGNYAVTDGQCLVTLRYVSDLDSRPISLYYAAGLKYQCSGGDCALIEADPHEHAAIIASEPLTAHHEDWTSVPVNHVVTVAPGLEVDVRPMES
jgi:ergothioneine biosynthesis protein EgtC